MLMLHYIKAKPGYCTEKNTGAIKYKNKLYLDRKTDLTKEETWRVNIFTTTKNAFIKLIQNSMYLSYTDAFL
ncbi:hypothetical protein DDT52_11730 [Brenneria roseae subsp. roseae]|nr:hypothetical protein DDT52_11730 [Brenneria roseae subsp. roseae]